MWNRAGTWGAAPRILNPYGSQEAGHWCAFLLCLPLALQFLHLTWKPLRAKQNWKGGQLFSAVISHLNFQNHIPWLLCYHFDPNVMKKLNIKVFFHLLQVEQNYISFANYFKCLWTGNETTYVAIMSWKPCLSVDRICCLKVKNKWNHFKNKIQSSKISVLFVLVFKEKLLSL